jgi:hypothetical protein
VKEMIKEKISASAWNLTSVEQLMTWSFMIETSGCKVSGDGFWEEKN